MVKYSRKRSKKYSRKRSKKHSRKRYKYSRKRSKKYSRKKKRQKGGQGGMILNPMHFKDYKPAPQYETITPSLIRAENDRLIENARIFGQNSMKIYLHRIGTEEKEDTLKHIEDNLNQRFPDLSEREKKAFFEGVNEIYEEEEAED